MGTVEVRCPIGPKRLFTKLMLAGEKPHITEGNLIEFACSDCKKAYRQRGENLSRVLHRYDLAGTLVETIRVK